MYQIIHVQWVQTAGFIEVSCFPTSSSHQVDVRKQTPGLCPKDFLPPFHAQGASFAQMQSTTVRQCKEATDSRIFDQSLRRRLVLLTSKKDLYTEELEEYFDGYSLDYPRVRKLISVRDRDDKIGSGSNVYVSPALNHHSVTVGVSLTLAGVFGNHLGPLCWLFRHMASLYHHQKLRTVDTTFPLILTLIRGLG